MNSPLDTIKQLKEMLDAGTITPQEFEVLKQQLVFGPSAPTAPGASAPPPATEATPLPAERATAESGSGTPLPDFGPPAESLPAAAPAGPPPAFTAGAPPAVPTETPEWLSAAPLLLSGHEEMLSEASTERRNPLTLIFAVGGALVLLALVLYLALDNKHDSERLTTATRTAADSTAVVPEVGPQSEQITLPPATAPETLRVAPVAVPVVPAAATRFRSDSVVAPARLPATTTLPEGTRTTMTTDTTM